MHFQLHVHRVRGPAKEGDELLFLHRPVDLGQHRLLAGLHQFPLAEVEFILVDDCLQRQVGRCTGADTVQLLVELVGMLLQVGKVLHPGIPHVVGHRQGELGSFQVT